MTNATTNISVVRLSKRVRKSTVIEAALIANRNAIPLEPMVIIEVSVLAEFVSYSLYSSDKIIANFFAYFPDVYINRSC